MINGTAIGNLVADVEVKELSIGGKDKKVATGRIAIRKSSKEGGEIGTGFYSFEAWGGLAETLENYTSKGDKVGLKFDLMLDRWTKDDQPMERVKLLITGVELCSSKSEGSGDSGAPAKAKAKAAADTEDFDPFSNE